MERKDEALSLLFDAAAAGSLRRAVFSRPAAADGSRITARLCTHKGEILFATERRTKDGKVYHQNISLEELAEALPALAEPYRQINILTAKGDAEYKQSDKGKEILLGSDKLRRALLKDKPDFSLALSQSLENKKNYILKGDEPFLRALAISDATGRIHDKKQAKFRQINRFLEHIRDIEGYLPEEGRLLIYDLCCGKSYLSFAVYHYFHHIRGREVEMLGMDLKQDCMDFCTAVATELAFDGMRFVCGDIRTVPRDRAPHLVLSLHACDIATDIVLHFAAEVKAGVILSTPCCQHDLLGKIKIPALSFVTDAPKLAGKLSEALTDALRLSRLRALGYNTAALELTDPDDTPKNTLLRAIRRPRFNPESDAANKEREAYAAALRFVFGEDVSDYPLNLL